MNAFTVKDWMRLEPIEHAIKGCVIQCPECKKWAKDDDWKETEVYCYDCGSHDAIACPGCGENFDHIYCEEVFNCRPETKITIGKLK